MTSATERLRALLDERGVEWMPIAWNPKRETFYHTPNGIGFCADEYTDGVRIYTDAILTPEQAIAATLGATDARPTQAESSGTCHPSSCNCSNNCTNSERTGTCHITDNGPWGYPYVCSECGASFDPDVNNGEFNYCPNCGRRVIDD